MNPFKSITLFFFLVCNTAFTQENHALSQEDFQAALKSRAAFYLLDIRKKEDYDKGHIRNSIHFNYLDDNFKEKIQQALDKEIPVYLYDITGNTGKNAALFLNDIGFKTVYFLEGGFSQWTAKSKPYVTSPVYSVPIASFTKDNLEMVLKRENQVLLYFNKGNCPKCTAMLKKIGAAHTSMKLLEIDSRKDLEIVELFKLQESPSYIYFKNGKQYWRYSGEISEEKLQKVLFQ